MYKYLIIILFLILIPNTVFAHPGCTEASGGHKCHKDCEQWGLKTEQYHHHNPDGSVKVEGNPIAPVVQANAFPTRIPTRVPTKTPTPTIAPTVVPTVAVEGAESGDGSGLVTLGLLGGLGYLGYRKFKKKQVN